MRSVSFLRAVVMSTALVAPLVAFAQSAPAPQAVQPVPPQVATVPQDEALQVQHQMGFSTGNSASQGRYYDGDDQYTDPHTGMPYGGAPSLNNPPGAF